MDSFKFDTAAPKREFLDHDFGLNESTSYSGRDTSVSSPHDAVIPQNHQSPAQPDDSLFA